MDNLSSQYLNTPISSEYPAWNQEVSEITEFNEKIKKIIIDISVFKTIIQHNVHVFEMKRNTVNYLVFSKDSDIKSKLTDGIIKILELNEKINWRNGKCFFASAYLKMNSQHTDVIWINEDALNDAYGDHHQVLYSNASTNEFMVIDPTMPRVRDTYESILLLASNREELKELHGEIFMPDQPFYITEPRSKDAKELEKILKINEVCPYPEGWSAQYRS